MSAAYAKVIMDTAKAQGRTIGLWQAEVAIRRAKGKVNTGKLTAAIASLEQAGRLERLIEDSAKPVWRVPAGRR